MKKLIKQAIVYSLLVGIIQFGLNASIVEASPLYNPPPSIQQQDDRDQDRHEAERIENERHERAMERRPNESEREWKERQSREIERHEKKLWLIAHAILI